MISSAVFFESSEHRGMLKALARNHYWNQSVRTKIKMMFTRLQPMCSPYPDAVLYQNLSLKHTDSPTSSPLLPNIYSTPQPNPHLTNAQPEVHSTQQPRRKQTHHLLARLPKNHVAYTTQNYVPNSPTRNTTNDYFRNLQCRYLGNPTLSSTPGTRTTNL